MAGLFDDLIPQKQGQQAPEGRFADLVQPPVQQPRRATPDVELSLGERLVSALPKGAQDWLSNPSIAGVGLGKGSAVHGAMMGASDPVVGAVQLAANLPGVRDAISSSPTVSDLVGGTPRERNPVNEAIYRKNAEYEDARAAAGREGFDAARLAGNFASPANAAIAAAAPIRAASVAGKALQGARAGVVGGAAAPVTDEDADYATTKVGQMLAGGIAGSILTPIAGKVGEIVARWRGRSDPQAIAQQTDEIINAGIERLQREGVVLPQPQIAALRQQVADSLRKGVALDAAAVARKADFDALGMQPTLGQITRDAAQFSREKNLRGVAGVGEPLLARFEQQGNRLQELVAGPARGAADDFNAGQQMMGALRRLDDSMSDEVGAAYGAARDHLGRAAPMDSHVFSTAANTLLDEQMLGSALPREARKILNDVTTGKVPLTVNSTVLIDRRLSQLQRDMARQGNGSAEKALGVVRDALNKAPVADNVGADAKAAFDVARGLARDRFKTHEMVPALKAAIDGDVSAQDFVRRFLVNGKPEEVARLAKVLPTDMRDEARRQLSAAMERAAFGANTAGDKAFAQESFNRLLQSPGMRQRLGAFFTPDEVAQLDRIGRVAAYTTSFPANSTVNTSNTAAAVANLVSRVPGLPAGIGLLQSAKNAAGNQMAVRSAMAAQPGQRPTPLTPEQQAVMARLLGFGAAGAGGATGAGVGR